MKDQDELVEINELSRRRQIIQDFIEIKSIDQIVCKSIKTKAIHVSSIITTSSIHVHGITNQNKTDLHLRSKKRHESDMRNHPWKNTKEIVL